MEYSNIIISANVSSRRDFLLSAGKVTLGLVALSSLGGVLSGCGGTGGIGTTGGGLYIIT